MFMILQLALGMESYMKLIFLLACMLSFQLTHAACPSADWYDDSTGSCYIVLHQPDYYANIYEARQACQAEGADIASIPDATVEGDLYSKILAITPAVPKRVYIGLNDIAQEGNYTWLDETTFDYNNTMNETEPNNWAGFDGEDCFAMTSKDLLWDINDITNTAWNDVPCRFNDVHMVNAVACKKPDGSNATSVAQEDDLFYQFIFGDCPVGWRVREGVCYGLVNGTEYLANVTGGVLNTSYAANEICTALGGTLPVVREIGVMRMFSHLIRFMNESLRPEELYLGHTDVEDAGELLNILGVPENYTALWDAAGAASPPVDKSLRCVKALSPTDRFASVDASDSYWNKVACCEGTTPFEWLVCEKPESGMQILETLDNPYWLSCMNDTNECLSSPCRNGATCENDIAKYLCQCVDGYTGVDCETEINLCDSFPCQQMVHGTVCDPQVNSYDCVCQDAWNGTHCETLIDPCFSYPCQNNATCNNNIIDYTCSCVTGFVGIHCETNFNDCHNVTCNNGTCVDLVNDYRCDCSEAFTGDHCEVEFSCSPDIPQVENATVTYDGGAFQNGYITYECNSGQKFDDMDVNKTIVCNDGLWSEDLQGTACTDHCEYVPAVMYATVLNDNTRVGNVVNYTCDTGYRFPDNTTNKNITCMSNGNWSTDPSDMEDCEIVYCPALPLYDRQHLNSANRTYGTTVTFWCDVGFVLHDNTTARTIKCLADGEWTAELPQCKPVQCPRIDLPNNSRRNTTANIYNTYAEYKCKDGMRMLDGATYRIVKCDATAEWSDNVTDCDTNRCFPLPFVANATPHTTVAEFSTRVKLTCIEGHKYPISEKDVDHMTCYDSGRWNPILSSCEPLYCAPLEHVLNAEVSENNTLFGTVVDYTCVPGHYVYVGPVANHTVQSTECLATKLWSDNDLEPCFPIQCPLPPDVEDPNTGEVSLPTLAANNMYNYSQQANYKCKQYQGDQYRFYDGRTTNTLTCGADGKWDKSDVSCRKERCDPVIEIPKATPDSYNTSWFSVINYNCNTGYTWPPRRFNWQNKTSHHVKCNPTGLWNETSLNKYYCDIKNCTTLEEMENSTMSTKDIHYNTTVQYNCDVGFKFPDNETEKSRWCSDLPQWIPTDEEWSSCEIIHCPELPEIENATKNSNETEYDTDVTYKCLPGYQFPDKQKQKHVLCTANETWTDLPDACEVIFCSPVPQWGPVTFNSTDNEFAATVSYECNEGHAFKDELETLDVGQKAKHVSGKREAYCNKEKQWEPELGNCILTTSLALGLAGNTTESEDAVSIGTICCAVMGVLGLGMVLLDLNKIWTDLKVGRDNVRHGMKKNNKVSDSQCAINAAESTA